MYCPGCTDDFCQGCEDDEKDPNRPMFELVYGGSTVLVGPCSGEDRDELIKLWGEPDAGRAFFL